MNKRTQKLFEQRKLRLRQKKMTEALSNGYIVTYKILAIIVHPYQDVLFRFVCMSWHSSKHFFSNATAYTKPQQYIVPPFRL